MKKTILYILVLVVVIIIGVKFFSPEDTWICQKGEWVRHGNPSADKPVSGCGENSDAIVNFTETGHLVKDNPGLKAGVWYLVYEKPGAPALTTELSFDGKSECAYNGQAGTCPDVLLPSSALTKVEGVETGDVVRVVRAVSGSSN